MFMDKDRGQWLEGFQVKSLDSLWQNLGQWSFKANLYALFKTSKYMGFSMSLLLSVTKQT